MYKNCCLFIYYFTVHQLNEYNELCCSHQEIYCFYCQPVELINHAFYLVYNEATERTQYFLHILHLEHINDILFTNIFDIEIYVSYYYYWMYVYETITQWIVQKNTRIHAKVTIEPVFMYVIHCSCWIQN